MSDDANPNVQIHGAQLKAVIKLKRELENPKALMKKMGAMVLGASVDSFKLQRLGNIPWDSRYPQQAGPKLNMAGFIEDFNHGRKTPKPIRFVDRPALIDQGFAGGLVASMTYKAIDDTSFQVGTNKPYASLHQYGGKTSIPITAAAKLGIRAWLYKKGSAEARDWKYIKNRGNGKGMTKQEYIKHFGKYIPAQGGNIYKKAAAPYADKVEPLLKKSVWKQKVIARPFVGIFPQLWRDLLRAIEDHFKKYAGGA